MSSARSAAARPDGNAAASTARTQAAAGTHSGAGGEKGRRQHAHQLRLAGNNWNEVARQSGYISAHVAQMAVNSYLESTAAHESLEARLLALRLEVDRLDALHQAFWPRAISGNTAAAQTVLRVMERRDRLLGLEGLHSDHGRPSQMIVVSGGDDMVDELKVIASTRRRD